MALEEQIAQLNTTVNALIEVVRTQIEVTQKSDALRAEVLDKAESVLKRKASDDKPAAKATAKPKDEPAAPPAVEEKPDTGAIDEEKPDTSAIDEAKAAVASFVRAGKSPEDIAERKKEVRTRLGKLGLKDDQGVGDLNADGAKRLTASLAKLTEVYVPLEDRTPPADEIDDI